MLARKTNLTLPELELPKSLSYFLIIFRLTSILGGLLYSLIEINYFSANKLILFIPVFGIFFTNSFSIWLHPYRTKIKDSTMRAFVQHTLALNYTMLTGDNGTNRKEMENTINLIIADHTGLSINEISKEERIADDLGID